MIDLDKWNEILIVLKKNKLRTFLTAFGVFWGIFMLIIMLGSGKGLKNAVFQNMGDFATNSCFMWTQNTSMPYKGFPRGRRYSFNNGDSEALRKGIPELKTLAPRIEGRGGDGANNAVRGEKTGAFSILGDYPDWNEIDPVDIIKGRYVNDLDIKEKRKIIVIGKRVVETLFEEDENPMNEYIQINGVYFKVVGVFHSKKGGQQAEREEQNIFMPFSTMQKTYNYGDRVGYYAMAAIDGVPVGVVEEKAHVILKKRHDIHPDDDRAIGGFNVYKEFKKMRGLFLGIDTLIWIVGIGTLLAGVIGVSNIMLVIVKERTKEIGIQRALGATPMNVILQIINESVFLTTLAGYTGLVFGVGLVELINFALIKSAANSDMFKNPEVDFTVAMAALGIIVFSGVLAGIIPAKRAVNIKPIEAIRTE
jgi:putative ABC transport system permease protein